LIAPRLVFVLRSGVRRPRPFLYPIRESVFEIRSGNTAEAKVWASLGKTNTLMWGRRVPGKEVHNVPGSIPHYPPEFESEAN
jgi:hypothetical protein